MDKNQEKKKFQKSIEKQVSWLEKWRKKSILWDKVMTVGAMGWMVVLPMVIGGYLGNYLDKHYKIETSNTSWTITFIILGLFIAIYSIWKVFFYKK
ncbi:MAG: AtpZ/AtpI family protein [Sulfurimonas sp.]|nr:AtpZ/AtpI family protein [Sulfurimonas sp.]